MKTKTTLTLARSLALSAALAFVPATHATEAITNGGFESPGGNGSNPTGWTTDFNSYGTFNGAAHSGSWGLHAGSAGNSGGRYQDITTEVGVTYLVSAWAQNFGSAAGSSHLDVLIGTPGDGSHTFTFPNYNTVHTTTKFAADVADNSFLVGPAWAQYTFSFTATATTTRVGIYNSYKAGDTVHSINVDDVSVVPVVAAHHIAASVNGTGGSISPSGDVLVVDGASQTFTITPDAHYAIAQVLVDGVNNPDAVTAGGHTFSGVTGDHTIVASFSALPTHTITATVSGSGGTISPSGAVVVDDGASQTFTITPNPGGSIADVVVDGVSQPAAVSSGSYTFSANDADHTITASFTAPPPQLFTDVASADGKFTANWSTGTQFTTGANPIYVTHLGYVDWNSADNGFGDGFTGSPQVGLWQGAHGDASPTLITTVTIPTGTAATLVGKFRYVTLPTPITLQANTTYQLMGYGYNTNAALTDPTVHHSPAGSGTVDPTLGLSGFRAEAHQSELGFGDLNDPGWTSGKVATSANFIATLLSSSSYDTWAATNAGGQTAGGDFDKDGVANGIEYFMGETGSSFTPMPGLDGTNTITWPMDAAYSGTYEVQTSPDLVNWTNVDPRPLPSGGNLSYLLPPGALGGKSFVRLLVTPAP